MWQVVPAFPFPSKSDDRFFDCLVALIDTTSIQIARLVSNSGERAVVVPFAPLCTPIIDDNRLNVDGIEKAKVDTSDTIVFVSTVRTIETIKALFGFLASKTCGVTEPRWVSVLTSSTNNQVLLTHLQSLGATESRGMLTLWDSTGHSFVFALYDAPSRLAQLRHALTHGPSAKSSEDPDHLRKRSEWFRRRSGTLE